MLPNNYRRILLLLNANHKHMLLTLIVKAELGLKYRKL